MMQMEDTICALSTPQGMGAIAMIRLSGPDTFSIMERVFHPIKKGQKISDAAAYSLLFGKIKRGDSTIDEVMAGVYRNPLSYTGEDVIEISCHGSTYIQEQIMQLLLENGARLAEPGEYTLRAYINGKMDLSQAEAVADLIASESAASHQVAMQQMRGGFSEEIKVLREELINFASLVELELDFAEEDVEFADRKQLQNLLHKIKTVLRRLIDSFSTGNVIKNGVPVAIVGAPNTGKSTLLNALLNEEKAIVTDIAGTTRDAIEDEINIGGIKFRFIDTAGIRETEDLVESIGIQKTFEKIAQSRIVLYLFSAATSASPSASSGPVLNDDPSTHNVSPSAVEGSSRSSDIDNPPPSFSSGSGQAEVERSSRQTKTEGNAHLIHQEITKLQSLTEDKTLILIANKMDLADKETIQKEFGHLDNLLLISALKKEGLAELTAKLTDEVNLEALNSNQTIVTNMRHYEALTKAFSDVQKVEAGLENQISGDFLAMDIREALKHLGSIIGEVETDRDILGNIFGKFCIGK